MNSYFTCCFVLLLRNPTRVSAFALGFVTSLSNTYERALLITSFNNPNDLFRVSNVFVLRNVGLFIFFTYRRQDVTGVVSELTFFDDMDSTMFQ